MQGGRAIFHTQEPGGEKRDHLEAVVKLAERLKDWLRSEGCEVEVRAQMVYADQDEDSKV
tara:strand:+ start:31313 stop:31492 length:180 start_codon:yes stop_codon:yes gene_type:complete